LAGPERTAVFPTVRVNFPPAPYVDVNREPYELDPRMFFGAICPSFANTRSMARLPVVLGNHPARGRRRAGNLSRSGLRSTTPLARIEALYKPYHRALRRLINKAHQAFGNRCRGGLPFDALDRGVAGRAAAGRTW